ncbi:Protein of unknown function DUF2062 [Caldalkalibacillus thermarum TA2.A1]|uniref:DUF2062 domain-containing protein n=1 Tax=Caldalkalibacillus thermarum (strain TA2.A1) TaxID=986075 RepID=F5L7J2_CALTT|nr:DUF2062 domain-containing protein [Caldalkalibacillus thermarum]EGL82706.1 Protein of unknown function DUF2062 [Caldalkalibacillus thermarum TA2.A1]QZT33751.1 DUF2062 domain-containing protein [Caldalkalibacillus thermarum TA2.A1]
MLRKAERRIKYFIIRLLRIKDKTHKIALGFTLGLLINFVPTFGFGPLVSVVFARLFGGNAVAGLLGGISLIWIFPLLMYLNFAVGYVLLPIEVEELVEDIEGAEDVLEAGVELGRAFFVGMAVNMLVTGIILYAALYIALTHFRRAMLRYIRRVWLAKDKQRSR